MKIRFHIHYRTEFGQSLKIAGTIKALGDNILSDAPYMYHDGDGHWHLEIEIPDHVHSFFYKYVVVGEHNGKSFGELYHEDRFFENTGETDVVLNDEWRMPFRGTGLAIPVFSIRTESGLGIGEFTDIKLLADWASSCGLKLIQILPVNDTTHTFSYIDSNPYAAISAFALHPIYLNIESLGAFSKSEQDEFLEHKTALNNLPKLDYEAVWEIKWKYIRHFYEKNKRNTFKRSVYQAFYKENKTWLEPYAVFCCLRDRHKSCNFSQWGEHSAFSEKMLQSFIEQNFDEVAIHFYVQYHLHLQLFDASQYAIRKGVRIKGDIPIGLYRFNVDLWTQPKLFHSDCQAGAPPDAFSETGQNWEFPIYNWDEMAKDDYQWWKKRILRMNEFFHAIRLDHILGFFRIWSIPIHSIHAILGQFSPALPLSIKELEQKGLTFNEQRLCKPFITNDILKKHFGKVSDFIKEHFLTKNGKSLQFKDEFSTQTQIKTALESLSIEDHGLENKLFKLLENVLFIEDNDKKAHFHPRIRVQETDSYKALDPRDRFVMDEIYADFYYYRNEAFWKSNALTKLSSILSASQMLNCGEDLGMVPASVSEVMSELQILSLIIQRMPNQPNTLFADLSNTPYMSVCSTSSHDMSNIREWWEENHALSQYYYNEILKSEGEAPESCAPHIAEKIIKIHLNSPSMWAIFPIQDIFAINGSIRTENSDERINIPGKTNHYWQYRSHISIEELQQSEEFNQQLLRLIKESGRF